MSSIFNMFARSPIRRVQKHMVVVEKCVLSLEPFFDAVFAGDWAVATECRQTIADLENEADDLKRKVQLNMPRRLFMSVPRSDVLALVRQQDMIADCAKDISGVILGREMQFPDTLKAQYKAFLCRCIDATEQARQVIDELEELQEAGFRGQEVKVIEKMIAGLATIETETDQLQISVRSTMFQIEKEWPPVDVMFMYKIIEWTGMLADRAQNVGDRLQMLIAR
jgi:predicted phosphate transport protein (TIGR00153 family)